MLNQDRGLSDLGIAEGERSWAFTTSRAAAIEVHKVSGLLISLANRLGYFLWGIHAFQPPFRWAIEESVTYLCSFYTGYINSN